MYIEAYLKRPKLMRSDGRMIIDNAKMIKPIESTLSNRKQPQVNPIPHEAIPIARAASMLETAIMA